jgi:iron complex outermembrane receptor protein
VTLEAGARGSVGGRLSYEVTAFSTSLENELVPFEVPDDPGVTYFRNSGSSSRDGVEAVLQARLHERLTGLLSYAYTDARFDDYVVGDEDFEDNQVPGLAPQELQASLRYDTGVWYLDTTAEYTDEVPVDDANESFADSYTLLDVRLGAESVQLPGGVDVSPYAGVRNLTDELYSAAVTVNAFGGRYFEPGPGRTFYVGLSTGWAPR